MKATELASPTPGIRSLSETLDLPRDPVNMGNYIEKSSYTDQSKICLTRKSIGERPLEALAIRIVSTDNENGELAKFCAGDATKSSISVSAPHTATCQSLDETSFMKSADGMSLNDNALNALKQEIQVKEILVKDTEENSMRLVKLNKENDNKLIYSRIEGTSFTPTTRLLPRKQKYILEKDRITPSSGSGHPMLGKEPRSFCSVKL